MPNKIFATLVFSVITVVINYKSVYAKCDSIKWIKTSSQTSLKVYKTKNTQVDSLEEVGSYDCNKQSNFRQILYQCNITDSSFILLEKNTKMYRDSSNLIGYRFEDRWSLFDTMGHEFSLTNEMMYDTNSNESFDCTNKTHKGFYNLGYSSGNILFMLRDYTYFKGTKKREPQIF